MKAGVSLAGLCITLFAQPPSPQFELVQPELFAAPGAQPNAWADADNDCDLDLFVGFQAGKPNRLIETITAPSSTSPLLRVSPI
jgi:hypothetical protein